jgi:hypothetical protein
MKALFPSPRSRFSGTSAFLTACTIGGLLFFALFLGMSWSPAQGTNKPLSKNDVMELLEGGVGQSDIADAARSHGLNFEMTAAAEKSLRDAGAEDNLMRTLRQLAPKPQKVTPSTSTTSSSPGPPVLLIEATPGNAQVYIDDEPKATTSAAGRVRFSQLAPGLHVVRLSLAGYRDYEQQVDLTAGQTSTVSATLQAAQTAQNSTSTNSGKTQSGGLATTQPPPQPPRSQTTTANATNANDVKFLVAHDHGLPAGQNFCVGSMTVGGGMVHYSGLRAVTNGQVGGPTHSMDISADEIKEIKKNGVYLSMLNAFHIKLKKGSNANFYVINAQGQYQPSEPLINAISSMVH